MYLVFGDVARKLLNMQCQYAARYLNWVTYPEIAAGIRWTGDLADYHGVRIHKNDVQLFVSRVEEYRRKSGQI